MQIALGVNKTRSGFNPAAHDKIVPMMDVTELQQMIERGMPGAHVEVRDMTGGGDHFEALVVSTEFEGKGLVERHQVVYSVLGDAMRGAVHALALKTLTPAQFENRR
jgi:stress-induced morphogen